MRNLVILISVAVTGTTASAQSVEKQAVAGDSEDGESAENIDALPGAYRIASAEPMRLGLALGLTVGYGYTEDVLQLEDRHHRMKAAIAATFRPMSWLAAGLRLDGRYDRHSGDMIESDDGWVGEARLNLLASRPINEKIGVGFAVVGWLPGGVTGFSIDAKAIASLAAGPALLSANIGFRLDRSAESVDDADLLSQSDRLALGVSDSNAVLLGIAAQAPLGSVELLGEATWDLLIGDDAPPTVESPFRLGVGARFAVTDAYRVAAMLEGSFGRVPFVDVMQPLVPVEPLLGINITVSQRPARSVAIFSKTVDPVVKDDKRNGDGNGKEVKIDPRAIQAGLSGTVVDDKGEPVSGAVVRVAGREVLTGDEGTFIAEQLEPGQIDVQVSADGFGAATETVSLAKDEVRAIRIILKRLEVGTLRGVVRGFDGAPIAAAVKIEPGAYTTSSAADGTFRISLPAGNYTATASADGFRAGSAKATIQVPGPVVIVNIELRKAP